MKYLAHIDGDREQSVKEHLQGTAELAEKFAAKFRKADWGYCCGMLHDIGKYSAEFQKKIKENLEQIAGNIIVGHAYASGSTSSAAEHYLKEQGYLYARAVFPSGNFEFPENPLNFRPSSSVIMKNSMKLVKDFIAAEPTDRDLLLFFWGHAYEMDYGKGAASWDSLERLFAAISGHDDIVYCTNREAFLHI